MNNSIPSSVTQAKSRTRWFFFTGHNCHGAGYEYTLLWDRKKRVPLVAPADKHRRTLLLGKVPPTMRRAADLQQGRESQRPSFRRIELGQSIVQLGKRENCRWRQVDPERPRCFHCKKLRGPMFGSEIGSKCGRAIAATKLSEATGRLKV